MGISPLIFQDRELDSSDLKRTFHMSMTVAEHGKQIVEYIPGIYAIRVADLPTIFYGDSQQVLQRVVECNSWVSKAQYVLFNTIYELEHQVIDALKADFDFPLCSVGPAIPHSELRVDSCKTASKKARVS